MMKRRIDKGMGVDEAVQSVNKYYDKDYEQNKKEEQEERKQKMSFADELTSEAASDDGLMPEDFFGI